MNMANLTDLTLNSPMIPGQTIYFKDVVSTYCTFYNETLLTCAVLVLVMYVLNEHLIKLARYGWEHPQGVLSGILPPDVRQGIAKFIDYISMIGQGLGFMASCYLVYFALAEGIGFRWFHYLLLGISAIVFCMSVVAGIMQKVRNRK